MIVFPDEDYVYIYSETLLSIYDTTDVAYPTLVTTLATTCQPTISSNFQILILCGDEDQKIGAFILYSTTVSSTPVKVSTFSEGIVDGVGKIYSNNLFIFANYTAKYIYSYDEPDSYARYMIDDRRQQSNPHLGYHKPSHACFLVNYR